MRKRVIPCIFLKNGMIIRSEEFKIHKVIGNPINQVKRYSDWAVDEIIYIDISTYGEYHNKRSDHKIKIEDNKIKLLQEISKNVFVPLGFGGGIRSINDIRDYLQNGADKVILNSILYHKSEMVQEAADIFGSQALVGMVDYKDKYVYFENGKLKSEYLVEDWCKRIIEFGIGEIILHDISRDGKGEGYDIETINRIVKSSSIPIIGLGGAGDYFDLVECFKNANPSGVGIGNLLHFKEHSYYHAKQLLLKSKIDVRKEWGVF
jgi:imidazole glycerol-phosphate synthase subunit HisF